eukprot:1160749-Pelagomonas_calceolata.AAC.3
MPPIKVHDCWQVEPQMWQWRVLFELLVYVEKLWPHFLTFWTAPLLTTVGMTLGRSRQINSSNIVASCDQAGLAA